MIYDELTEKDIERFWSKVDKKLDEECWEWLGKIGKNGAGTIRIKGKNYVPYRISHLLKTRLDDPNKDVFHLCNNISCVNPLHLYIKEHNESIFEDKYIIESFWSKVDMREKNDCWNWTAYSDKYGCSFYNGKGMMGACRFLYILKHGEIPKNSRVKHHCKNFRCCNPDHLYLDIYDGTIFDNTFTNRFWRKVDIKGEDSCWNWLAGADKDGYGFVTFHGITYKSTHIAYMITYGEFENGLFVCHKCDNPSCVNPKHLFLGTGNDNVKDRHSKKRDAIGSQVGTSKLNEEQVSEIMRLYFNKEMMVKDIAEKFGINRSTITKIAKGTGWQHVEKNRSIFDRGRKLTKESANQIRDMFANGVIQKEIALLFNIDQSTVSNIISGRRWPKSE
jgi:predicted XRE-type DNA-binding protein